MKKRSQVLACFSPPVMIATFVIEVALAVYTFSRYKFSKKTLAILAILLCLAAFQLAEYFVCMDSSVAVTASRLGFVAITFLPPLGLYLMGLLTKPLRIQLVAALFGVAIGLSAYFLLASFAFQNYECTGNYVIFSVNHQVTDAYGAYYFGLLAVAIWYGAQYAFKRGKKYQAARWLLLGYALFIVPVGIITVIQPDVTRAIPSVLCGFAITLAIVLAAKVAPLSLKKK